MIHLDDPMLSCSPYEYYFGLFSPTCAPRDKIEPARERLHLLGFHAVERLLYFPSPRPMTSCSGCVWALIDP